jgi:hypothetical protein
MRFRIMTVRCVAASIAAAGCAPICTEAYAQYSTPNMDPVTRGDCHIIAEILNTKTTNPLSFSSFGATCDWSKLKPAVRTTNATTGWRVFVRHPEYDAKNNQASVTYADSYNGMYGSHEYKCSLEKEDWAVADQRLQSRRNRELMAPIN